MNCSKVQSLLSAYADSELTGVQMILMRQHLHDCAACCKAEAEVRRVKSMLAAFDVAEPSVDFEARLVSAVMGSKSLPAEERRLRSAGRLAVTSLAAAATICILYSVRAMPSAGHGVATSQTPVQKVPTPTGPNMAVAMQRDSAFINSADPLSGPQGAVAASYAAP
ncbi:MAG: anti-sigma factor family protein [Fimbriimonadaceae bacterium]